MTNQEGPVDEEQIRLSGEAWAVVPKTPLTELAATVIGSGLRHAFPDKRFVVFGEPVDLVPLATLDEAWKAAEAALPEGWRVGEVKSTAYRGDGYRWLAMAWEFTEDQDYLTFVSSYGNSPVEALTALRENAARLSEGTPS